MFVTYYIPYSSSENHTSSQRLSKFATWFFNIDEKCTLEHLIIKGAPEGSQYLASRLVSRELLRFGNSG